jgi:7,8-dihydropterin-6-yl-methyl-4-(beta-D-ribofuranosyl)aminobenzene 5'-phosphate synthase
MALVSDAPARRSSRSCRWPSNTADGVVLVVGCSPPGIEKIVEAATTINPKIR